MQFTQMTQTDHTFAITSLNKAFTDVNYFTNINNKMLSYRRETALHGAL